MEQNFQTFLNKRFPGLKTEKILSPGILFSIFYTKWKIEQWKILKTNAFILSEDLFKQFLMTYVEEGQEIINVNSIQVSISSQVLPEERGPLIEMKRKILEEENKLKLAENLAENEQKLAENEQNTRLLGEKNKQEILKLDLEVYTKKQKKVLADIDGKVVLPLKKQSNCEEIVKISKFFFISLFFAIIGFVVAGTASVLYVLFSQILQPEYAGILSFIAGSLGAILIRKYYPIFFETSWIEICGKLIEKTKRCEVCKKFVCCCCPKYAAVHAQPEEEGESQNYRKTSILRAPLIKTLFRNF